MKNSKQTLTESSFILILSTALVKIIGALFKIPLASDMFLGEVGFGYYSVAHDLYTPFYTLAISGLPVAVSHIIAEKISQNLHKDACLAFLSCKKLFIICGVIFSAILALSALPLLLLFEGGFYSAYSVLVIIPSVFFCFVISVYRGYFEAFSNMYPTAFSKVIEALCKLVLGLLFSFIVLKATNDTVLAATAAMLALTLGTAFSLLYLYVKYRRSNMIDNSLLHSTNEAQNNKLGFFLKLSTPFALASILASLVAFLDIFTVKMPIDAANEEYFNAIILQNDNITGDISAYLYGVRSKAFTVYNIIPTITTSLGIAALPIITGLWAKNDKKALSDNVLYTIKLVCTVTFPAAIGLLALSSRVMPLLYSSSTPLADNLLRLYALTGLFSGFCIPLITVLQAIGKHRTVIINIFIGILIKVVLSVLLVTIPKINIYAAPLSTLFCYIYITVSVLWVIVKTLPSKGYFYAIFKPLFCALICGGCAYAVCIISKKNIVTLAAIIFGGLVYLAFIFITKTYKYSEIISLPIVNKLIKHKKR